MNAPSQQSRQTTDVSWSMLLAIVAVVVGPLYLLCYNVIYTEGEVMQGLFTALVCLIASCIFLGFYRRRIAVWCVTLAGGLLLLWQSYQIRKWAMIHEDVIAIIRFADDTRSKTGRYPTTLESYPFKRQWIKSHIYDFGSDEADGFRITYFMNDPGISYWYSSKTGFGYYPD